MSPDRQFPNPPNRDKHQTKLQELVSKDTIHPSDIHELLLAEQDENMGLQQLYRSEPLKASVFKGLEIIANKASDEWDERKDFALLYFIGKTWTSRHRGDDSTANYRLVCDAIIREPIFTPSDKTRTKKMYREELRNAERIQSGFGNRDPSFWQFATLTASLRYNQEVVFGGTDTLEAEMRYQEYEKSFERLMRVRQDD